MNLRKLSGKFPTSKALVAVLNSHQSKRPCRADPWVEKTFEAVTSLDANRTTLITSVGLNTWELLVHLADLHRIHQLVVIPELDEATARETALDIMSDFKLSEHRTEFGYLADNEEPNINSPEQLSHLRDQTVMALAQKIIPVSIHPKGRLSGLLDKGTFRAVSDLDYAVPYQEGRDKPRYELERELLASETISELDDCIVHWTRSSHIPFEGISRAEFYHQIINCHTYPSSALESLKRIAAQNRLIASRRFIRGGFEVVSFTDRPVADCLDLMRWRRRYLYYNFEPYGIAVDKAEARKVGLRSVFYGDKCDYDLLSEEDRPYFQLARSEVADWTPEAEWRHLGTLNFATLPDRAVKFVVSRKSELAEIRSLTSRDVLPLLTGS